MSQRLVKMPRLLQQQPVKQQGAGRIGVISKRGGQNLHGLVIMATLKVDDAKQIAGIFVFRRHPEYLRAQAFGFRGAATLMQKSGLAV
jgi:hypothetical protein